MCLLVMNRPCQVCEKIVNTIENVHIFPMHYSGVVYSYRLSWNKMPNDGDSVDTDLTSNFSQQNINI